MGTALRASFYRNQFQGPREWVSPRQTQEYSREIWGCWDLGLHPSNPALLGRAVSPLPQIPHVHKGSEAVPASGVKSKETESLKYVLGKVLQGTGNSRTVKGEVGEPGLKRGTMGEWMGQARTISGGHSPPGRTHPRFYLNAHSTKRLLCFLKSGLETQARKPSTQMAEEPDSRLTWAT